MKKGTSLSRFPKTYKFAETSEEAFLEIEYLNHVLVKVSIDYFQLIKVQK